jgi:UPF0716 protein FxsA
VRRVLQVLVFLALFGLIELVALWYIGQAIGVGLTTLALLAAALLGFRISKAQGLGVFHRWINAEDDSPADEGLVDGILVLAGGVLLILPGVIGDLLGLMLLTPPLRRWLAERIRLRAGGWVQAGQAQVLTVRIVEPGEDSEERPRLAKIEAIEAEGFVVEERPERLLGP